MKLYFITGNSGKFSEAKSILPEVEQIEFDLPEIQELDGKKIIEEKLKAAMKQGEGAFFCEDTSLSIECLNGLPGTLIKWFLGTIGNEGIWDLIKDKENKKAIGRTIVGFVDENGKMNFFEGISEGEIVKPRVESNFGWDSIFKPAGFDKTYAEMTREEKNQISMRRKALSKLKDYLDGGENEQ